jgi:glycosyltransferase involved in cell wall biosynthesis
LGIGNGTEKMNIVHISTLYFPFLGGLEVAVQKIAENQAKLGHDVNVLTSNQYASDRCKVEQLNGVKVHRIGSIRLHYPFLTVPIEEVNDLLKEADVIHGWGHTYYFVYRILTKAKKLGKPTVTYFIGVDYLKHHYNPLIRFTGFRYQKSITKRMVKVTDLALVTNDYEKNILEKEYGIESTILPHGVSELYFKTPDMARSFREKYKIEGKIIAYIGRIHSTKGLDLLIKAFREVAKHEADVVLLIAGKGDIKYLNKCINLANKFGIGDKVKYLGYLSEEDKIGLIDASEVVVIPSRHSGESYPLIVDEVKARGKPLVVTDYGALPNRIVNSIEGVVVNANVNSLARGIRYALFNSRSFKILTNLYTWTEIAEKLITIYDNVR